MDGVAQDAPTCFRQIRSHQSLHSRPSSRLRPGTCHAARQGRRRSSRHTCTVPPPLIYATHSIVVVSCRVYVGMLHYCTGTGTRRDLPLMHLLMVYVLMVPCAGTRVMSGQQQTVGNVASALLIGCPSSPRSHQQQEERKLN
jgi:hypothetical protein